MKQNECAHHISFIHGNTLAHASFSSSPAHVPATQGMATEKTLNQIVKGGPPPSLNTPPPPAPLPLISSKGKSNLDPYLSTLPSSPPQIYLNLLILESSLRAQYLHLLSRRRLNTFFILLLAAWNGTFTYFLFFGPRLGSTGEERGGSVYWFVETSEKIALLGGAVTVLLVWATGQWERGIRWPRRWLGTTNRGLRGFNLRVVIVRGKWWRDLFSHMAFLLPFGLWREAGGSDWHLIDHEAGGVVEEDLAPGGDHIMLLLLPKSFSPEFRENWEEYRAEYWETENARRRMLRVRVKAMMRTRAKEEGGWMWWTGTWRIYHPHHRRHQDREKHPPGHQHRHNTPQSEKDALAKAARRRSLLRNDSAHSRQSSRSSTPHLEFDGIVEKGTAERTRRGSSSSIKRKTREKKDGTSSHRNTLVLSPLTAMDAGEDKGSRPGTPGSEASSIRDR